MTGFALTLILCAPPAQPERTAVPTKEEFLTQYSAIMTATRRSTPPDPERTVPELCRLHGLLPAVERLPRDRRRMYQKGLESRLRDHYRRLVYETRQARKRGGNGGGAVPPAAGQLINLIINTVSPNSWVVNGGQGTISYWNNPPALIIRQSSENHHQIGGVLRQLQK